MRGNRDLQIVLGAALLCAIVALACPVEVISLIFAAPLALFLPGFAIASAMLPGRGVDRAQLFILSVGLSLSLLALGSLALNYLGGLRALPWAILLLLIVLGGCRAAAIRRASTWRGEVDPRRLPRPAAAGALMILGAAIAASAAIALAVVPVNAKHALGYTELWMQPFEHRGAVGVRVGVGSDEQHASSYRLWVRFGEDPTPLIRHLSLRPGQKQVLWLPTAPPPSGGGVGVVARLYRHDHPALVYRRVTGWVPAPGRSR
ncbi:MAG: DUF1616 domain-containing protein [Solirubrobacterales bacterium]